MEELEAAEQHKDLGWSLDKCSPPAATSQRALSRGHKGILAISWLIKGANIPMVLGGKGDKAPTTWQQHGEAVSFALETGQCRPQAGKVYGHQDPPQSTDLVYSPPVNRQLFCDPALPGT